MQFPKEGPAQTPVHAPKQAPPPKPPPALSARPTRRASLAFMEMLRGASHPPLTPDSAWDAVSAQFADDRRFQARRLATICITMPSRDTTLRLPLDNTTHIKIKKWSIGRYTKCRACVPDLSAGSSPLRSAE